MRILLVYPSYPETFWSFSHALPFIGRKAVFPPLGLITVAAMLPESWEKRLLDLNVERLTDDALRWADYLFISAMTVQRGSAADVIRRASGLGLRMVAGGPLFTTCHDEFPEVDHILLGEAEATLPAFLQDLQNGMPEKLYRAEARPDLSLVPLPLWELVDIRAYGSMNIQYSRGCPYDCEFCDITHLFGKRPRTKALRQVVAELDALYFRGWRGGVFFVDDNFIGDKVKLKQEILPGIISWMRRRRNPFHFYTEASINLADDVELMELMVAAGFREVFVGIESTEEESLDETGKVQNKNRDLLKSVRLIHRAGLQVEAGFIVGFDSDTPSVFENQLRFVQESGIVTAMVGILMALRGTKLYRRLASEGRILTGSSGNNTEDFLNFVPRMSPEVLLSGYRRLVGSIYSPVNYYERVVTFLREYRPSVQGSYFRLQFREIRAFFQSMLLLGIFDRERRLYWKLFLWSLTKKPRLFPLAITLSIYGYHFRKVAEGICQPDRDSEIPVLRHS